MSTKDLFRRMIGLTPLVFLLTGCRGTQATATPTHLPITAPTVISARGDKEWDYVAWGDSTMFALVPRYAAILEQDLGVKVRIHNWTAGSQNSSDFLQVLRTNESLRQDIREADALTFIIPTNVFQNPMTTFIYGSPTGCGGTDNQDCLRKALEVYKTDTDAIIAEVVSLRSPSEALIRMRDNYLFMVKDTKAHGRFEVVTKYWREANKHVIQVATKYHIPVVRSYEAFGGPNGDEDPVDKGYVSDGIHPTEEGADLMAELFRKLGYEYAPKP